MNESNIPPKRRIPLARPTNDRERLATLMILLEQANELIDEIKGFNGSRREYKNDVDGVWRKANSILEKTERDLRRALAPASKLP